MLHRKHRPAGKRYAAVRAAEQRDVGLSTPSGSDPASTAKPWFIETISTLPVVWSLTGWLAPWWPLVHLLRPAAERRASIWWPRQMPKTGISVLSRSWMTGTAYLPGGVAGQLERKMPSGCMARISADEVCAGTT